MKKILPFLTALLFLLSSCASPNAAPVSSGEGDASASTSMSVEDTSESIPEEIILEEEEPEFERDPLNSYPFHYGETLNYEVSHSPTGEGYLFECPDIPTDPISCSVMDFDGDGADELLLFSVSSVPENRGNGWNEYTLRMSMFEGENGEYMLSADRILTEDGIYLPWSAFSNVFPDDGTASVYVDCYTYGEESVIIAVETSDCATLFSDGIVRGFASYTYTGDSFEVQANDILCGSSFDDETEEPFALMLSDAGIDLNWDDFLNQKTFISNHVRNYNCLLYMDYHPLCSYEQMEAWKESEDETLNYASASIYTESEIEQRSSEIKYVMPLPSMEMPAFQASSNQILKAYINVLENFVYNALLPNGEEVYLFSSDEQRFAIYDVDHDDEDELLIDCCNASNGNMNFYVFKYDHETGKVEEEFSGRSGCTFYEGEYITDPIGHNDSMTDFWPYTLHGYDHNTDSYQFLGTVFCLDKDVESRTPYQYDSSIDTDHNGRIYCIIESYEDDDGTLLVDDAGYKKWLRQYITDQKETTFNWLNTTEENVYCLLE